MAGGASITQAQKSQFLAQREASYPNWTKENEENARRAIANWSAFKTAFGADKATRTNK
jgi:hypothetical protein